MENNIRVTFQKHDATISKTENISLDIIIQSIQKDIEQYAILFISSSIILNPKQRKIMNSFTIPISELPISSDSSSVDELKRLTEKAVGMSLDTLFAS